MQTFWPSVFIATAALAAQTAWAGEAGTVIYVVGKAEIAERPAALGAPVNEGQLLSTGRDGYIYIRTVDKGLFILRPNSKARIDTYVVDKDNPANTRVKLELLSGVARSQSGEAVKHARQNFRFNTPVAAIGVRGTDFTVFTDQDTSRVTVLSGGITMSGFGSGCAPEGAGPCEGGASRELSAAQKGLLLQVRRGDAAPRLMQGGGTLAPDVVAPPRGDEPQAKAGTSSTPLGDVNLDARKNEVLQERAVMSLQPNPTPTPSEKPPPVVVVPPVEPEVIPPAPPPVPQESLKEVSWGRWAALAGKPANTGIVKAGAERIAVNDYFVLFRSNSGSDYAVPEKGSIGLALVGSEAYVRTNATNQIAPANVQNGQLLFDFDKARFNTKFDVVYQAGTYNMYGTGVVGKDGVFSGINRYDTKSNMDVNGVLSGDKASYLFQGMLDSNRSVIGATSWAK